MRGSVVWTCEYRECDKTFKRYNAYIKQDRGKYCCQIHASLEQNLIDKEKGGRQFTQKISNCFFCNSEIIAFTSLKKHCDQCRTILANIAVIKKEFPNLQDFTPSDYNKLLELQDNKCAICGMDKCKTGRRFAIDHDHETGKIRGLLCLGCNTKLGWYDKNKTSVQQYLDNYDMIVYN